MRSAHVLVHALWVGLAISAPLTLDQPSLDARHVTPSAAISESLATHALKKRLTADEILKGIALDSAKVLPVSYLLALAQSWFPWPKPATSGPPAAVQQAPVPGGPSPQNPAGGYYPGGPLNQDPRTQPPQGNPQSYYDPSTNQQAYYQDPRTNQQAYYQDPRDVQQAQQLASAGGQQTPPGSQPEQTFGRAQVDLSQMTPQSK